MSDRTVVVIGCSTTLDYAFLLPVSCLLWRDHIGHMPLALLVGDEAEWRADPKTEVVLDALHMFKIAHRFIGRAEGYPDHTTAQNARQHAAALPFIPDDWWVMPSDADLWPLRRAFYHQHVGSPAQAVCYYSNGDHFKGKEDILERAARGHGSQTLPTCHATMRARTWRELYDYERNDVSASIKKTLDGWYPTRCGPDKNMDLWMSDQQVMTERMCVQEWFPSAVKMIARHGHPPTDRLDRSMLPWNIGDASRWTDAHVHRSPWENGKWGDLLTLISALLPKRADWARLYRETFVNAELPSMFEDPVVQSARAAFNVEHDRMLTELFAEPAKKERALPAFDISILLPTRKRPDGLTACVRTLMDTAAHPERVEYLYATDLDDRPAKDILLERLGSLAASPVQHREWRGPRLGYRRMFDYYNLLASKARGRLLFVWNDDCEMVTQGWDELLLQKADGKPLVQFIRRDIFEHADDTFPVVDRRIRDHLGYIARLHCACDTWLSVVSQAAGNRLFRDDIIFHHHRFQDEVMAEGQQIAIADSPKFGDLYKEQMEDAFKIKELIRRLEEKRA